MKDLVVDEFSGGAHCCYRVGVKLSSTGRTLMLPFQLDGGICCGEDLPDGDQFAIGHTPDGVPEMLMLIETTNGAPQHIPRSWRSRYGITGHRIAVSFPAGKVHVRNLGADGR